MLVGAAGPALGIDGDHVRVAGAVLLIALAAVMLVPAWSERFTRWMAPLASGSHLVSARFSGASLASALALGAVLGLVWSPCSGPLLASALALVASEGGVARGGLIRGAFGVGAAIPLVAVAYASRAGFTRARGWVLARIGAIKTGFALLLGAMGVAILTGADKWLEARVNDWLPDAWLRLTVLF
jgi:cytochrome c biogenesis protein CcdA